MVYSSELWHAYLLVSRIIILFGVFCLSLFLGQFRLLSFHFLTSLVMLRFCWDLGGNFYDQVFKVYFFEHFDGVFHFCIHTVNAFYFLQF